MLSYINILVWPLVFIGIAIMVNVYVYKRSAFQVKLFEFKRILEDEKSESLDLRVKTTTKILDNLTEIEALKDKVSALELKGVFK